jgi:hypothetical protein
MATSTNTGTNQDDVCSSITFTHMKWPDADNNIPPNVLMLAGYKRTGKDTLAGEIQAGKYVLFKNWNVYAHERIHKQKLLPPPPPSSSYICDIMTMSMAEVDAEIQENSMNSVETCVVNKPCNACAATQTPEKCIHYEKEDTGKEESNKTLLSKYKNSESVAFGTELKNRVYALLGLNEQFDYESNKDKKITSNGMTLRDYMIAVGSAGRKFDISQWAKLTFIPHFLPKTSGTTPKNIICRDFRFIAEEGHATGAGINAETVRIFRSEVPIPAYNIESEHDLDMYKTDYLFVRDCAEYDLACKLWPYYCHYEFAGKIETL